MLQIAEARMTEHEGASLHYTHLCSHHEMCWTERIEVRCKMFREYAPQTLDHRGPEPLTPESPGYKLKLGSHLKPLSPVTLVLGSILAEGRL